MLTCTRLLSFDAAHRILGHEGQCANLHGHRYLVEVEAIGAGDDLGRIVDFSVLKDRVGGWLDRHWDHTTILSSEDLEYVAALSPLPKTKPIYLVAWNPTAENMARFILDIVCPNVLKDLGIQVVRVRVRETPNCFAEAKL
jgi:6-pyruvoyltetrahydropterin/6-carboxytetrahydropterin synthase